MTDVRSRRRTRRLVAAKVSISLSPTLLQEIDKRADRSGATRSEVIRGAVERLFKQEQEASDVEQWIRSYREQPQRDEEVGPAAVGLGALQDSPWDEDS